MNECMVWGHRSGPSEFLLIHLFPLTLRNTNVTIQKLLIWNLHSLTKLIAMLSSAGKFDRDLCNMKQITRTYKTRVSLCWVANFSCFATSEMYRIVLHFKMKESTFSVT